MSDSRTLSENALSELAYGLSMEKAIVNELARRKGFPLIGNEGCPETYLLNAKHAADAIESFFA